MSNMLKKLDSDIKESMKARNTDRVGVLRMVMAAVKNKEIEKRPKKITEDDVLSVLAKEIKEREEGIKVYTKVDEKDRVSKLEEELEVLREYIPSMDESEVEKLVLAAIEETGASSKADIGKVLGHVMPKVRGQATAGLVSKLASAKLGA